MAEVLASGGAATSEGHEVCAGGVVAEAAPASGGVAARILRRSQHSRLLFCEALVWETAGGRLLRCWLRFATEPQDSRSLTSDATACCAAPRVGDAIVAQGHWERRHGEPRFAVSLWTLSEAHQAVHGERAFQCSASSGAVGAEGLGPVSLVLQCEGRRQARMDQYCKEMFPEAVFTVSMPAQGSQDWLLLIRPELGVGAAVFLQTLQSDATVCQALRRAFIVEPVPYLTFRAASDGLAALLRSKGDACDARVQVHPRYMERGVVDCLAQAGCLLSRTGSSHTASLVYADAVYYVGLSRRDPSGSEGAALLGGPSRPPAEPRLCRAQAKLAEALSRSGWAEELGAQPPRRALDVGAAPGGWSACLATRWGCREVVAVDPGELAPGLAGAGGAGGAGRIRHLRVQWREALQLLCREGAVLDVLVCDANMPCDRAVELVAAAAGLLAHGARVVLTFKDCSRNRAEFERLKGQQIERLRELCTEVREVALVANRRLETTVLARAMRTVASTPLAGSLSEA
ncbi:unnamed protein product [Prorocentrum cordatum]|uniref:Ribosomal RNA methyltransferase FtsJ domain-containing protein n=1 Tax=Prorocentrum cordatum TaxID=2364126 RepID=A0ABN9TSM5_9DINO|nr:unnamed protein product [Polarella glacialis]